MFQLNQGNGVYSCTIEVSVFLGSQTVDLSYLLWPTHDHLLISFYLFFVFHFLLPLFASYMFPFPQSHVSRQSEKKRGPAEADAWEEGQVLLKRVRGFKNSNCVLLVCCWLVCKSSALVVLEEEAHLPMIPHVSYSYT